MSSLVRVRLAVHLCAVSVFSCLLSPLWTQVPEPFLSYDFEDGNLDDFFVPESDDLCGTVVLSGDVTTEDGELVVTNDEVDGVAMLMLRTEVVDERFPAARNYRVRLRFNLVDNLELLVYLKARWGSDEAAKTADSQLERGYAFTVFTQGLIPNFLDGTLAVAEWSACHEIVEHSDWPDGTFGAGWADPGFPILPSEWYWLELSAQGDDNGGPVILTGRIWEDGEDAPEEPQLVVSDPNGLNHDEQTLAPEAEVQLFIGTGFDLDLNFPLATTLLDDISLDEIEVSCAGGLSCLTEQETGEVTLSWSQGQGFQGTLELRRDGEVIATPDPDQETFTDQPGEGAHVYELAITADEGVGQDQCSGTFNCRAVVASDFFFFDDFNTYADDDDLVAAGWEPVDVNNPSENATFTVTNPGGRANPPTVDGSPTYGRFLISDSDFASGDNPTGSGMSHDIWTPTFSCDGAETVWLHADVFLELNNNGVGVFDVDVSTDDGESWTNVFRRVAPARTANEPVVDFDNADNLFGPLDIDISAQAANEPEVRVRFRNFEPSNDWWIAIDNFLVDSTPVTGGSVVVLETESFDDEIPDDWSLETLGGGNGPWDVLDPCGLSLPNSGVGFPDVTDGRSIHHLDESFALVSSFCSGVDEDEFLATPILDCSRFTNVFLQFESDVLIDDDGSAVEEVLLSLDGGGTFEEAPIFSYQAGGGGMQDLEVYYNEFVLEIPRAVGESQVVFAFHYKAPLGEASFWAIDNVQVTAEGDTGVRFVRADINADGNSDVSDSVFLLSFLFGGAEAPPCRKAADTNDDSSVDLSDVVFVLNYLFSGGPPPPAPSLECGLDSTDDDLGCESFAPCEG